MVTTTSSDDARAAGPVLVRKGPRNAPIVLVIDPAGEAKHDELPATWRPLAEHLDLIWCRLPASLRQGVRTSDLIATLDTTVPRRVHVVAGGLAVAPAIALAAAHLDVVASMVLVDPPADLRDGVAELADQISAEGTSVRLLVGDHAGPHEPPLPIGHPDVVQAVVRTLIESDVDGAASDGDPVGAPQLTSLVHDGLIAIVSALRGAVGQESSQA
jgi:hypothetical protein